MRINRLSVRPMPLFTVLLLSAVGCKSRPSQDSGQIKQTTPGLPTTPAVTKPLSQQSDLELSQLPADYTGWTAKKKLDYIWEKTVETKYQTLPEQEELKAADAILADPSVSMNRREDTMPSELRDAKTLRKRVIHLQGSLVKVKYVVKGGAVSPFTGMFATGADHGVLRFSLVGKVGGAVGEVTPGFGLKLFADGVPSPSLVAMYTLTGQGDNYNFFQNDFFTMVPDPKKFAFVPLDLRFRGATDNRTQKAIGIATLVSAEPFSEINQLGKKIDKRKSPHILKFEPSAALKASWGPNTAQDVRVKMTDPNYIKKGTLLYKVFACDKFVEIREECAYKLIGEVVAESNAVASRFADKSIFFNHRAYNAAEFDTYPAPQTLDSKPLPPQ